MNKYQVEIRDVSVYIIDEIEASSEQEAQDKALEQFNTAENRADYFYDSDLEVEVNVTEYDDDDEDDE